MDKKALLESINFGDRVAENEADGLKKYFVRTDQWRKAIEGSIDIFYGLKGSGKSAIYSLLQQEADRLLERNVLLIAAENPRGATAFKDIVAAPPTSETEFVLLWKLYFLCLIANTCANRQVINDKLKRVTRCLEEAGLLATTGITLAQLFSRTVAYVRKYLNPKSLEMGTNVVPSTAQIEGLSFKVSFDAPTTQQATLGTHSLDALMGLTSEGLETVDLAVWLAIDRLDVAFAEHEDLEANALRALFKTYLDLQSTSKVCLKIFLRSDIWRRITMAGFGEASHITRTLTIDWSRETLLNLVMRRLLQSDSLCSAFGIDREAVLADLSLQEELFYDVFPKQVDVGEKKLTTFDWLMSRTADGNGNTAPANLFICSMK